MPNDLPLQADANTQYKQLFETYREVKRAQGRVIWMFLVVNGGLVGSAKWLLAQTGQIKLGWIGVCIVGALSCLVVMTQILSHHNMIIVFQKRIAELEGFGNQVAKSSLAKADELVGPLSFRKYGWYIAGLGVIVWAIALVLGLLTQMYEVLVYWRDYRANWAYQFAGERAWYWHSSARCVAELLPGDRMWMVTSGRNLRHEVEQAAFLVGVWAVREVIDNPNDDLAYPTDDYRKRVVADPSASVMLADPVPVDHILRPAGRDRAVSIGRFLQGPRVLSDEKRRLLRAAAGGELAAEWLRSKA